MSSGQSDSEPWKHFSWMAQFVPVFGVRGGQVEVLTSPTQFYQTLKDEACKAKRRIVLSSLYLGTGKLEKDLVECLYAASRDVPNLDIQILLDYTRGSRGGETSSRTMLLPLLRDFAPNVRVALYHTPDLRGIWKHWLPERYNETVGLQHMKVYLFDDNLIISGANLSDSYFTNRQDRYILLRNCRPIADFFSNLVHTVSAFSFQLKSDNTETLDEGQDVHPYEDSDGGTRFREAARNKVKAALDPLRWTEVNKENGRQPLADCDEDGNLRDCTDGSKGSEDEAVDTWVCPMVQMMPLNIDVDHQLTEMFLCKAPTGSRIHLASGYFNLTENYQDVIVNRSSAVYDILTAAPEANGFYNARGIAGSIPDAYTYIAKQFFNTVCTKCQQERITLREYTRTDWTFHGKGLWCYLPGESKPCLTLVGSPNFGSRSVNRDLEAQIAIITKNKPLQEQLQKEQFQLYSRATEVTVETFDKPERHVPLWVTFVTKLIKPFL